MLVRFYPDNGCLFSRIVLDSLFHTDTLSKSTDFCLLLRLPFSISRKLVDRIGERMTRDRIQPSGRVQFGTREEFERDW